MDRAVSCSILNVFKKKKRVISIFNYRDKKHSLFFYPEYRRRAEVINFAIFTVHIRLSREVSKWRLTQKPLSHSPLTAVSGLRRQVLGLHSELSRGKA